MLYSGDHSASHIVNRFREALDVAAGDASNGYPAVFGCIYGELKPVSSSHQAQFRLADLFRQLAHLLWSEAGVGKHANLGSDMVPIMLAAQVL